MVEPIGHHGHEEGRDMSNPSELTAGNRRDEGYEPTRSTRFYPAISLSDERQRRILENDLDLEDLTIDDLLYSAATANTRTFYAVMSLVEERWGEEAAHDIARALGRKNGKLNWTRFLQRHGVTHGTSSLMSKWQDLAHALRGPDHANAVSDYTPGQTTTYRTRCAWHTGRPEGAESYCKFFAEECVKGYIEVDSALRRVDMLRCMSYGDDHCAQIFWYEDPEASTTPSDARYTASQEDVLSMSDRDGSST